MHIDLYGSSSRIQTCHEVHVYVHETRVRTLYIQCPIIILWWGRRERQPSQCADWEYRNNAQSDDSIGPGRYRLLFSEKDYRAIMLVFIGKLIFLRAFTRLCICWILLYILIANTRNWFPISVYLAMLSVPLERSLDSNCSTVVVFLKQWLLIMA